MAQWKKVIVSGSNAELAAVSASIALLVGQNQQITTSPSTTFLSGSFSGSFEGNVIISSITVPSLTNDRVVIVGSGGILEDDINFTFDGTDLVVGNVTINQSSGDITGSNVLLSGDIAINGGDVTTTSTTFNLVNTTATTVNIGGAATTVEIGANSGTTSINNDLDVDGDINVDGGDITTNQSTFNLVNTTATTVNFAGAATTLNVGNASGLVDVKGDLTVGGDLTVLGDVTSLNTTNLLVEDKFILLNSGSSDPDEAGIIVDEGAGSGHAFIFDSNTLRWAFTGSLDSTANSVAPDAFVAAVVDLNTVAGSDVPEYQKAGNIKIDTIGEIWIWA